MTFFREHGSRTYSQGQHASTKLSSVLSHKYVGTCGKGLRGEVEERGGVDAVASSTTNDKEIVRKPLAPIGLGRDGPDFFVAPPRRCYGIDSSSCLDFRTVALPTTDNVFMGQNTSLFGYPKLIWDNLPGDRPVSEGSIHQRSQRKCVPVLNTSGRLKTAQYRGE